MADYFEIGKIVNTQGIKGDVRVTPFTFDKSRFELLREIDVIYKKDRKRLEIERVWYHKQFVILKFKGVDDMSAGEQLRDGVITIPREAALPLNEDEYYMSDLFGMSVVTEEGEVLGVLDDILETGANDVYFVKNKTTGEDILIPAIKQCIVDVDLPAGVMTVRLLEGLRT